MIWADRVAIGLAILAAFVVAITFVSSDAALRLEAVRAHIARLDAACAQQLTATREKAAAEGSADTNTSPPASDAGAGQGTQTGRDQVETANSPDPQPKADSLPARICFDEKVREELESEEEAITVPTVHGTLVDIAKLEVFGVLPVWAGLRYLDFQSGGPRRRLSRSVYWRATQGARRERRRRRRERLDGLEPGER